MAPPRVRFAPSPSGYLHIGGARTALFNWLWARRSGGCFIVRIEDTDQERSSLESVQAILQSLRWLGLDWDEGPEVGGPFGPYFQSERKSLYRESAERLIRERKAYRCYCSKEDLDAARQALKQKDPKAQFVYPGTCRNAKDDAQRPHVVRFLASREGSVDFVDRVFGPISTPNKELQDFVLVRRDGLPLYNLAAVVDDHAMGISLVARGRDHLGNTPQQILLYRALGWEPPEFAHLPMMLSQKGEKLAKRHAAVSVREYQERGYPADAVLNYLARFGWSLGDQEIFGKSELVQAFSWDRVSRSDGRFDERKFADVVFEHLKRQELTSDDAYMDNTLPFLEGRGLTVDNPEQFRAALGIIRQRARSYADAAQALDYYFREPPEIDPAAQRQFLTPEVIPRLEAAHRALDSIETWQAEPLEAALRGAAESQQLALKELAQPLRVAVTGRTASPPLFDVLVILGRSASLRRIAHARDLASRAI